MGVPAYTFLGASAAYASALAGGNMTPALPAGLSSANKGALLVMHTGCNSTSLGQPDTALTALGWTRLTSNGTAVDNCLYAKYYAGDGSDVAPTFQWDASHQAYARIFAFGGDVYKDLSTIVAASPAYSERATSATGKIAVLSASAPAVANCLALRFGHCIKTAINNGVTAFNDWGTDTGVYTQVTPCLAQNGTALAAGFWYNQQTTATGTNTDIAALPTTDTNNNTQGITLFLKAQAQLADTASAGASASGTLTNFGGLVGGAIAAATGAGNLLTAIRLAVAASVGASASSALTNWSTVTLAGVQYTGAGGLHDPVLIAQGWNPPVGAVIYWDATNATCYTNGEISAITNNCSFVAQYNDGSTFRTAIIIITPQMVAYATVAAAAAASLTTAIQLAVAAVTVANATGQLTAAIRLAGSAASIANAAAALITGIQLNAAATAATAATGALSGGQASLQTTATVLSNALGTLSAKIQFAGAVVASSVVAGAIATQIQLAGATAALTNAGADIQVAIRLAGDAVVGSSAAGAALITSSLSAAAHAVSTATGSLFTALQFAGQAFVSSSAQADLSTGISLAGAAEVDTQAAITPVGQEGQFGRADINVLSPTGFPTALAVFIEGSTAITTIAYFNSKGLPFVPQSVQWTVLDLNSGVVLVPYTSINPVELSNAITISGDKNSMVNQSRSSEQHEILFRIVDNASQVNYARAIFEILSRNTGVN